MKTIFFPCIFLSLLFAHACCNAQVNTHDCFTGAFSSGYVFKHDDGVFNSVYGRGMGNVITADFCYYPWHCWGIGGKSSYWLAFGRTTFFKRHTKLHEIPITFYVRRMIDLNCCLQLYASLGGGVAWMRESSYLGKVSRWKGIGEVEAGLHYPLYCNLNFTSAFRYIFPRQSKITYKK